MGIDRLVALLILELCGDIGGERHLTDLVEGGIDVFLTLQFNDSVAVVYDVDDLGFEQPVAENELRADLRFLTGLDQRFPAIAAELLQQQEFDLRAGILLDAVDTRGDHAGVVDDQTIALVEIVEYIIKTAVLDLIVLTVKHHQSGMIPRFDRRLRDLILR